MPSISALMVYMLSYGDKDQLNSPNNHKTRLIHFTAQYRNMHYAKLHTQLIYTVALYIYKLRFGLATKVITMLISINGPHDSTGG